jgi:hypothetical protein
MSFEHDIPECVWVNVAIIMMMFRNTLEVLGHGGVCNELHFAIMLSLTYSSITNLIRFVVVVVVVDVSKGKHSTANKQKWK